MNLYEIVFSDNSTFSGGDLINTKWKEIPDKQIRSIFYALSLGDAIVLSGYNKYYHMVEIVTDLSGDKKGIKQLEFTYLIGKKENKCKIYKFNLRTGQIEIRIVDEKDKFIQSLNQKFWR